MTRMHDFGKSPYGEMKECLNEKKHQHMLRSSTAETTLTQLSVNGGGGSSRYRFQHFNFYKNSAVRVIFFLILSLSSLGKTPENNESASTIFQAVFRDEV